MLERHPYSTQTTLTWRDSTSVFAPALWCIHTTNLMFHRFNLSSDLLRIFWIDSQMQYWFCIMHFSHLPSWDDWTSKIIGSLKTEDDRWNRVVCTVPFLFNSFHSFASEGARGSSNFGSDGWIKSVISAVEQHNLSGNSWLCAPAMSQAFWKYATHWLSEANESPRETTFAGALHVTHIQE